MNKKIKPGKAQKKPSHQEKGLTREEFHGIIRKAAQPREKGKNETSESRRADDYTESNTH